MQRLLVVVDFQNDFVTGALGFEDAPKLDRYIAKKVNTYVEHGYDIAVTYDTHQEDYLETQEGERLPVEHCIEGSEGWQLYGETGATLQALDTVHVFKKDTFGSIALGDFLRDHPFESIEFVGLVSNMCVLSNAVIAKAAQPEAEIIVDAMGTDSFDGSIHEKALDVMQGMQMSVINREGLSSEDRTEEGEVE